MYRTNMSFQSDSNIWMIMADEVDQPTPAPPATPDGPADSIGRHYNPTESWMLWTDRDYKPRPHKLRKRARHNDAHTYFGY